MRGAELSSVDAITAVNDYVDAFNTSAPDAARRRARRSTRSTTAPTRSRPAFRDPLAPDLRDALNAWVDAARGVATAIAGNYGPDEFNAAIDQVERHKTTALRHVRRGISMNLERQRIADICRVVRR